MPGHYHNKHEVDLANKDEESIVEAGVNFEKIASHSAIVSLGLAQEIVSHGKSDGQVTVNSVAAAVAAPKIDERNVYSLTNTNE
jgi:hypothetical protein